MNILVTGANGQLGHEMQIVAQNSKDNYIFTDVCDGYQNWTSPTLMTSLTLLGKTTSNALSIVQHGQM